MAKNKLFLTSDKTHLLVMASKSSPRDNQDFKITLNTGTEINNIIILNDMEWNQHVKDHKK